MVNVVAATDRGPGRSVILNGHLDTFPVGDRTGWERAPFSGEVVDGKVFGRGVSDMKAGTTASLIAFSLLSELRDAWKGRLTFAAVADEVGSVLGADGAVIVRLDPDGATTLVASVGAHSFELPVGSRWTPEPPVAVAVALRTCRPARCDDYSEAPGEYADAVRRMGIRSSVAVPIVVEGRLWGGIGAGKRLGRFPADTDQRMAWFTELVGTAIANADSRTQLTASRARIVAAADDARRRIERDLHDGTQQQLVALALGLRAVEAEIPPEMADLKAALGQTAAGLARATDDLQTISRGIHPAILSQGGIGPALRTLARRAGVPVKLCLNGPERLPERAEVAAYYVVSEALSNAAKHARASAVHVGFNVENAVAEVSIRDDGIGGADPDRGSGLVGLRDRVEALGGTIQTTSLPGQGTCILARVPVDGDAPPQVMGTFDPLRE